MMDAVTEGDDFDLMVMGRSQGQGCYCFVNGLVQTQVQKLQSHYPYIVVDNEAGMEHVSRGILPNMEKVLLVSDCSRRGVQATGRIAELMREMNFHPDTVGLIINRAPNGELDQGTRAEIEKQGLTLLGVVPQDDTVYRFDCDGGPWWSCRRTPRCAGPWGRSSRNWASERKGVRIDGRMYGGKGCHYHQRGSLPTVRGGHRDLHQGRRPGGGCGMREMRLYHPAGSSV